MEHNLVYHSYPQGFGSTTLLVNSRSPPQGRPTSSGLLPSALIMAYELNWFNFSWLKRIKKTINPNQVPCTQSNFPLLVNGSTDLIGAVEAELRFAGGDGIQLEYEIEEFDSITGELIAWVKKPSVSDDDAIYIYYDNFGAVDEQDPESVWDPVYRMVHHMTPPLLDSTNRNNDGTNNGSVDIAGQIGQARDFDGINDKITVTDNFSFDIFNKITMSAWVKTTENFGYVYGRENQALVRPYSIRVGTGGAGGDPKIRFGLEVVGSGVVFLNGDTDISAVGFSHIVGTYDGVNMKVYLNGVLDGIKPQIGEIDFEFTDLHIGERNDGSLDMDGSIDEVRLLGEVAKSADWIKTEYNNQFDTNAFYTTGAEENVPSSNLIDIELETGGILLERET